MPRISDTGYDDLEGFWSEVEPELHALPALDAVAQRFADVFYARFAASVALVRVFGTVPMSGLPAFNQSFARRFAADNGIAGGIDDRTLVLSLLGTRGVEERWNDRRTSRGHVGIPLASERFIGEIPMIARLFDEIGFRGVPKPHAGSEFVTRSVGNLNGIFFVPDARTTVDERGRKIIPAAEFVERYDVRTVFGFGGSYVSRLMFLTVIVFCREAVLRSEAMKFVPLIGSLKSMTTGLVKRGAIFAQD